MDGGEPHLLVVDDDARLRELLRRYLTDQGFRVTTAGDATEARARLASFAFDLLVLDVMMPGEDGLEFTRSLRTESPIPILLLTAKDRVDRLECGAADCLAKPFEPRELVSRVRNILHHMARPQLAANEY
jgi:two-component system phosphate regulon response regulator OmpR